MKKIAKIIAAMTVAVAAFALVGCADGMSEDIEKAYTPETPAAAPAERTVGTVYPFILDYDSTNADFENVWTAGMPKVVYAKVTNLGTTEEPNKITRYCVYGDPTDDDDYETAGEIKFSSGGMAITDNNTSIEISYLSAGISFTYKAPATVKAGTYELKSGETIFNGVSTAYTAAQLEALGDATVTTTGTGAAAVSKLTWAVYTNKTLVELAEDENASITVSGDDVTVAYVDDQYTIKVFKFSKAAEAANNSGNGGNGGNTTPGTSTTYYCYEVDYEEATAKDYKFAADGTLSQVRVGDAEWGAPEDGDAELAALFSESFTLVSNNTWTSYNAAGTETYDADVAAAGGSYAWTISEGTLTLTYGAEELGISTTTAATFTVAGQEYTKAGDGFVKKYKAAN